MQGFTDIIQKEEGEREPLIKDIENTDKDLMESTFGNTSEEDISTDKVVKAKSDKPGMKLPEGHGNIGAGDDISMCPFMKMGGNEPSKKEDNKPKREEEYYGGGGGCPFMMSGKHK